MRMVSGAEYSPHLVKAKERLERRLAKFTGTKQQSYVVAIGALTVATLEYLIRMNVPHEQIDTVLDRLHADMLAIRDGMAEEPFVSTGQFTNEQLHILYCLHILELTPKETVKRIWPRAGVAGQIDYLVYVMDA